MKIWTAPEMQELDVKLTAKRPCTVERAVQGPGCIEISTYNTATHEYDEENNLIIPIKSGSGS